MDQTTFLPADYLMDNAQVLSNPKVLVLLESERLVYSEMVKKFSPCHFLKQDRLLVITSEAVYNIKKDKLRRRIPFKKLQGITKN